MSELLHTSNSWQWVCLANETVSVAELVVNNNDTAFSISAATENNIINCIWFLGWVLVATHFSLSWFSRWLRISDVRNCPWVNALRASTRRNENIDQTSYFPIFTYFSNFSLSTFRKGWSDPLRIAECQWLFAVGFYFRSILNSFDFIVKQKIKFHK